jgi:hypothetical protein
MIMAYKLPTDLSPEELTEVLVASGSPLAPNPVQDVNDLWFISEQEWNYPEWQGFKEQYPEIAAGFEYTEYVPNPKYTPDI